ncbi:MAG: MATE family efflux transporter [Clostridia bacterium]|nr:MATE family efflux transporter [Clostridia bacterium]
MAGGEILGTQKMWKLCLKMGIPCVLAQVVNLLYNIVDRIYIGHMSGMGDVALAGLGLCAPILTLISAFSSFVSGGGAPLAAKALGEGEPERAKRILNNGFVMLCVFSVVLGLAAYFAKTPLLNLIGASENTYGYADDYLSVYLIGTLFVQLAVGLNTFLTAQGKSTAAMLGVGIGAVLNIGLDPLFIFTFNMGIKGAALATVISQAASCAFVVGVLSVKRTQLRLSFKYMTPKLKIIGAIVGLGLAPFVMSATESVIGFVLNGRLNHYGDLAGEGLGDLHVSALAVLQSVMMLITVPVSGFTQGVTPILSFNYGAKNKKRLKQAYFITLGVCWVYCSFSAVLMMSMPHLFGKMFTSKPELLAITDKYLPVFVAGMLIFGIQRACQTTFVAVTEAKISLFIAVLRKIILLVPFAFLFPLSLGVGGVYWAECAADATAATLCGTIFFFRFRKILKGLDAQRAQSDNAEFEKVEQDG